MSNTRGSILLFKATGSLVDRAISYVTGGDYVHIEIALDGMRMIGAHTDGISVSSIPVIWGGRLYTAVDISQYTTAEGIENGIDWALQQVGREYGWADIAFQAVKFIAPNNPLRWGIAGHFDCSDFATRYLIHAGVQLPDNYLDSYTVTPNDLGRAFGLVPARKPDQTDIPIAQLGGKLGGKGVKP